MCIAIPMKIEAIDGLWATVNAGGLKRRVSIELTPAVKPGDYVLVHAGYAIERLEKTRAEEDLKIWEEMKKIRELLAQEEMLP